MDRCPNCRARYSGGRECQRCGMELSALLWIEAQAEAWERFAIERLTAGDRKGAKVAAAEALARQHRPLALMLWRFAQQASEH
jgi:hypothetical protein